MSQQADGPELQGDDRAFNGRIVVLVFLSRILRRIVAREEHFYGE